MDLHNTFSKDGLWRGLQYGDDPDEDLGHSIEDPDEDLGPGRIL